DGAADGGQAPLPKPGAPAVGDRGRAQEAGECRREAGPRGALSNGPETNSRLGSEGAARESFSEAKAQRGNPFRKRRRRAGILFGSEGVARESFLSPRRGDGP